MWGLADSLNPGADSLNPENRFVGMGVSPMQCLAAAPEDNVGVVPLQNTQDLGTSRLEKQKKTYIHKCMTYSDRSLILNIEAPEDAIA